jgi:hypothetical protein
MVTSGAATAGFLLDHRCTRLRRGLNQGRIREVRLALARPVFFMSS